MLGAGVLLGFVLARRWVPLVAGALVVGVLASRLEFEGRADWFGVLAGAVFAGFELFGAGIRIFVLPEVKARR